jgi:hypothetical protein
MSSFFQPNKRQPENTQQAIQDPNKLTGPELDFILRTLKTCTLKGEQIEQFYNIVIKLQNQYMDNNIK